MHDKDWEDIGYNFLVGGDGSIFEGRGWDIVGAHTLGYNRKSIGFAFIGDYRLYSPTKEQVDAALKLLELGVKENKLTKDYKVLAHSQVTATQSPGINLFNVIKTWEHWSETP